jgi:hypothetical protein
MCMDINVIGRTVPRKQLFKAFIYIYFAATCFGPRWPSSGGIHNIFGKYGHVGTPEEGESHSCTLVGDLASSCWEGRRCPSSLLEFLWSYKI